VQKPELSPLESPCSIRYAPMAFESLPLGGQFALESTVPILPPEPFPYRYFVQNFTTL